MHAANLERIRYSILARSPVGIRPLHALLWGIVSKVKLGGGVIGLYGPRQAFF